MFSANRLTSQSILAKKKKGEKIVMLTAYDFPLASFVDQSGVDIVLVGDSLANVVLGLDSTRDVGMEIMLHHTKAVNRAVKRALLVGDMPYHSYEDSTTAITNARRFIHDAGCQAVKVEWFDNCPAVTEAMVKSGIPVMGHVGLTPQTAASFKVQGQDPESAHQIIEQAKILEAKGCFSIVLECIPDGLAKIITKELKIPTIGIGAGPFCDGQVLVTHDMLGLFERFHPKFAKQYADLGTAIKKGVARFASEVRAGKFPDAKHSFTISKENLAKIKPGQTARKKKAGIKR